MTDTKALTKKELRRLAKEARVLAMECLTNGPRMEHSWCGCAIGICLNRAGLWSGDKYDYQQMELAADLDALFTGERTNIADGGLVSAATYERVYRGNPTAVVFPLLAWADALES